MAIYKPTYCYPYGGNVDFCVDPDTKAIYLQCKLNTSNKKVTGYKLTLVDNEGKVVWEPKYISPVDSTNYINFGDKNIEKCGFNGDTLIIPFIQNLKTVALSTNSPWLSSNCLYANVDGSVDFFIESNSINYSNIAELPEVSDWNNEFDNSSAITIGDFFVEKNGNVYTSYIMNSVWNEGAGMYVDRLTTTGVPNNLVLSDLPNYDKNIHIRSGVNNHDSVWNFTASSASKSNNWLIYIDDYEVDEQEELNNTLNFKSLDLKLNSQYSWKITLYQGDIVSADNYTTGTMSKAYIYSLDGDNFNPFVNSSFGYVCFSFGYYTGEYSVNQYDILITQGQILGSNGERLQIYPADVVLQKYYVQLGEAKMDSEGRIKSWTSYGTRGNIEIYDSSYGHIYPQQGHFNEDILKQIPKINACVVFKHSNNPADNLESDMVTAATSINMSQSEIENIIYYMFSGGLLTIDDYNLKDGDLVLLKDLNGYEYLNGVYVVNENSSWKRSGSYKDYSQFIGKIILVKNGSQNTNINFECKAHANQNGVIGAITGFGLNAIRPVVSDWVVRGSTNYYYFYEYNNSGTLEKWSYSSSGNFNFLLSQAAGTYILYINNEEISSINGTNNLPEIRFVPSNATSIDDCEVVSSINVGDICWTRNLFSQNSGGFIKIIGENTGGNTKYFWTVNNLTSEEMGSKIFFIPEQGVILYPNYENLPANERPQYETTDFIGIDKMLNSSVGNLLVQYNLKKFVWSQDPAESSSRLTIENLELDGYTATAGNKFVGVAHYINNANWTEDYGTAIRLCEYNSAKNTSTNYPFTLQCYSMVYDNGNNRYHPTYTQTTNITLSSTPQRFLEFKPIFVSDISSMSWTTTGGSTVSSDYLGNNGNYRSWAYGASSRYTKTESTVGDFVYNNSDLKEENIVGRINSFSNIGYSYYLVEYSCKRIQSGGRYQVQSIDPEGDISYPYNLSRKIIKEIEVGMKVTLKYLNNSITNTSLACIKPGTSYYFENATSAGIDSHYYLGEYLVRGKDDNISTLSFTSWSDSSSVTSLLPNYSIMPKKGEICGNSLFTMGGNYREPYVQLDITNKIGILNINSVNETYIKPFYNIQKDQYLVFTDVNETERRIIDVDDKNYGVKFYRIGSSVINNLWTLSSTGDISWGWGIDGSNTWYSKPYPKIGDALYDNPELEEGEGHSYGIIESFSDPIYSSVTNVSTNEPYKYKIMSYFKDSDYNPVTYSGNAKIGFDYIRTGKYAYELLKLITKESHAFVLEGTIYSVIIDQEIEVSQDQNSPLDILLRGYYRQGAGKRWEYYRMAIFDNFGNVLQDTGNVYNGDFSQYFWGLKINESGESSNKINYALLIIEDEFSKIYTTGIKISISPLDRGEATASVQKYKYNYNLQSIDIQLTGLTSNSYTLYRKENNSNDSTALAFDDIYHAVDRFPPDLTGGANRSWNIRDYNITNSREYRYYLSQDDSNHVLKPLDLNPIATLGKCWSITNLYPTDLPIGMENSTTIKKKYVVDENNVWLFKYNGEFGSQTQNIAKSEQGTLGKYPRMGQGMRNNQTGSISALLGSEIIPGKLDEESEIRKGYQERLRSARGDNRTYYSSNESIDMLEAWRSFVQSKNPKLLKDVKGQSWIVQITSNQNTPMAHVQGKPDTISFSWIQIGDTKDISIVGSINKTLTSDY